MITEDYVSLEIAKLLKEKGFNEKCSSWYSTKGSQYYDIDSYEADLDGITKLCSCPTQQMAMRWLREVHNIYINLDIHWLCFANSKGWMYVIEIILENGVEFVDCKGDESDKTFYLTYEQAVEAAIKYCLENLI